MGAFQDPAAYWGLDPQVARTLPLGLRSSNNLFNIKYFQGAEKNQQKWPGLLGPSSARDQGDPQMLFADPESSGVAAANLLRRKYDSGMRTPRDIIAGRMGWTPGRTDSAAAVAKYAGVGPDDDLRLDTPEGMKRFLPALATQEHGTWARDNLFAKKPDLFDRILARYQGEAATGEKKMAGSFFDNPVLGDIRARNANANGSLAAGTPDGDAFLKRYGINLGEDAQGILGVYALQRDFMQGALKPKPVTWGDGIGEALKAAGAVMTARNDPKLGMQLAGTVGQDFRERGKKIDDLTLSSALQQAQLLGTSLDSALKAQMEAKRKKAELEAINRSIDGGGAAPGAAVPSGPPVAGAPAASPIPQSVLPGAAAPVAPGMVGGAPGVVVPGAPATAEPAAASKEVTKQIDDLTQKANRAARLGAKDIASNLMDQAKLLQEQEKERRTNLIREYEYAVKNDGYSGSFEKFQEGRQKGGVRFGLQPIPVQNPDGTTDYVVPNTAGEAKKLTLPDGSTVKPKVHVVDTPTEKLFVDAFGQVVKREPKDIAGKEIQEQRGQAIGKAQVDLPKVQSQSKILKEYIDAVRKDANLPNVLGVNAWVPTVRPTSRTTEARIAQLKGKAFLSAFESLKGAGAITETEGAKATDALARLNDLKQDEKGFREALDDFVKEVDALSALAEQKAGGRLPGPTSTLPATGGGIKIRRLD